MKQFLLIACMVATGYAAPVVWLASAHVRVGPTDATGTASSVALSAALGETQSFQVIVQAPMGGLSNVNVSVSDLTGPGGAKIPSNYQITLYSEHYVAATNSSYNPGGNNQPLGTGLYADALVPFLNPVTHAPLTGAMYTAVPASIAAGRNQPFWVDVAVPRAVAPGNYSGTVTVSSTQGNITANITLTVWHFALPVAPTLQSSFGYRPPQNGVKFNEEVLLANRIMPFQVNASDSASLMLEGLSTTGLPFFSSESLNPCSLSAPPSTAAILGQVATYAAGLNNYLYAADEIDPCVSNAAFVNSLSQWAANTHAAGSKVLVTVTPVPTILGLVDIYGMMPKMFLAANSGNTGDALGRGAKFWMYNALVQDNYSPKWEVDFAPINYRIVGFLNNQLGFSGMLYSGVDLWTSDPWNNVDNPTAGNHYNGEDILVYPGAQVGVSGVVPSMRLKWLRQAVNDYEYMQMLRAVGQGAFATGLVATVAASWSNWSKDPAAVEAVRQQLGAKLDQLIAPPPPANPYDVNGDGVVNILDVQCELNVVLGKACQ